MPRRSFLQLAAASLLAGSTSRAQAEPPPHIVFFLTDDLGYGDLGFNGGQFAPTPNIDRFAAEGTRLEQFYVAAPICSPSRAGATTGQCPGRWRITSFLQTRAGNRACEQADYLDPAAPSLARTLRASGYATGHFGKWHLGGGRDVQDAPKFAAYGFDEHVSTYESPEPHPDITSGDWIWSPDDKVKRWDRTRFFVDQALDFLGRHRDQPCYVNIWPDDVHTPWVPSSERLTEYPDGPEEQRKFAAVLDEYDRQFGRFLAGLERLGLADNTLVIFTSDNGPMPTFGGRRTGGLRGSKLSLYEGGIRMPTAIRWPGHVPAGRIDRESVVSTLDLFPTLCGLAGAPLPAVEFDGEDRASVLRGEASARTKPLFWEYGRNDESFAYPGGQGRSPNVAVREGRWKYLVQADGSRGELYDLQRNPGERVERSAEEPDLVARLRRLALDWRASLPGVEGLK